MTLAMTMNGGLVTMVGLILEFRASIREIETSTKEKVNVTGLIFSERRPLSVSSQDAATTPMQ